ncbi:MAG: hypothetical protein ACI82Z_001984 [Cellvibrionaceae bacterium]|jgi:hypothetical protein
MDGGGACYFSNRRRCILLANVLLSDYRTGDSNYLNAK